MRINRPTTGTQQNQGDAKRDQIDTGTGVWIFCNGAPQCKDHYHRSRDGRPQSRNHESSVPNREQVENGWFRRLTRPESVYSMNDEGSAGDESHEQEPYAGPTKSECGE